MEIYREADRITRDPVRYRHPPLLRLRRALQAVGTVETVRAEGDAAAKILETAKARDADLIVVGSRGLGAVAEML